MIHCESHHAIMKVLIPLCFFALTLADEDGSYVPDNSGQYVPTDEGQYIPDFSGRYIHDGSGNYKDDGTGRYAGDSSGRFSRQFDARNANLLAAGTAKTKQILQPEVQIKSNTITRSPSTPSQRAQPLVNYNNYQEGKWKILKQLSDVDVDGYHWEYETENKITAEESGKLHNVGTDAETMRAKGFYQYTGPDNVVYTVEYTADENGFIPVGNHLPTPPPIPEEIAKTLKGNK